MKKFSLLCNKFILLGLLLALVSTLSFAPAAAETLDTDGVVLVSAELTDPHTHDDDCVIPDSGPWPPCATGGNDGGSNSGDDCVIPPSGPWPPCATGGDGGGNQPAPGGGQGQPCPPSGVWPPGCTPNGGGGSPAPAPNPGNGDDCVIPPSGPWPPCATDGDGSAPAPAPAPPAGPSESQLRARVELALDQLETYWKAELKQQGVNYRPPGTVQIYRGEDGDPPNAFYIPSADAVFIDLNLLDLLAAEYGEYSAVAVLAHEWGHFIQDQLNLLSTSRPLRGIELQADCFTGSFTQYLSNTGQLKAGEKENASDVFYSIGDDIINPDAPYNQPGAHGTGDERRGAFEYGWANSASACLGAYNN